MNENRVEEKLDRLINEQHKMAGRMQRMLMAIQENAEDIKEHMRRTEASEKRLDQIEKLKYYVFSALVTAALLSSPLQEVAVKLLALIK